MSYRPGLVLRFFVLIETDTCSFQSPKGVFVNGVWGPYKVGLSSAMLPLVP